MSIRFALVGGLSVLMLLAIGIVVALTATQVKQSVVREAQSRVDHALSTGAEIFNRDQRVRAERLRLLLDQLQDDCTSARGRQIMGEVQEKLRFAVLNCVGPVGEPLAGSYENGAVRVPVELDPVIRRALSGELGWGTVLLEPDRLRLEGGPALATSQIVSSPQGSADGATRNGLFQWFAVPLRGASGTVTNVIYGGAPINHDHELVDSFVEILFGEQRHDGRPLGTVTLFLEDVRVATNVQDADGRRAIGTRVSDVVRERVLEQRERWRDRAWVVDAWYISGYLPLLDPDGETIGMLYVGLLEAPYDALQRRLMLRLLLPALILLAIGIAAAALVVQRITRPLEQLRTSAGYIEKGRWDSPVAATPSYREITELSGAMKRMQAAIVRRDRDLGTKNLQLSEANTDLVRVNDNYMSTLRFVTHELKAPLANIQSLVDLVISGYVGEVADKAKPTLIRIQRNCEELQDMVKNYLDLSRAERGYLDPKLSQMDFRADVVGPVVTQSEGLFRSREMTLEIDAPEEIPMFGDPELLRIALTNYLTNATKYGKEGGRARLVVADRQGDLKVEVWNEGEGFSEHEHDALFKKLSRLKNPNTRSKKGSGLGLYLTDCIVTLHGGYTKAESEPGAWARFSFQIPFGSAT